MTTTTTPSDLIAVHGRAGLLVPYARFIKNEDDTETQVDISASTIFVEIPGGHLRKQLVSDPNDSYGLRILLLRSDVEKIPDKVSPFIVLDETGDVPVVDWEGRIIRTGYKGDPTDV